MMKGSGTTCRNSKARILTSVKFLLINAFFLFSANLLIAQGNNAITHEDSLALENVIVERYYVSDSTDYTDTTGNALPKGSVTYRVFIDMKPGYTLQSVYGSPTHELFLKTSTTFFNDTECYAETGFNIDAKKLQLGSVALDSWITMGAASRLHTGIPRSEDKDGSMLITNRHSFDESDGLTNGVLANFRIFNLDLNFFDGDSIVSNFSTFDGGWAAMGGIKGPTPENKVLIAQLTTNGKLTFSLNVQIGKPNGGYMQFVATESKGSEIQFKGLAFD